EVLHLAERWCEFPVTVIKEEVSKRKGTSSPGSCGIRWAHLAQAPDWLLSELGRLCQLSYNTAAMPAHWRNSQIVYLPKPTGYGTLKGVRPITLSCILGKLMEALISRRLSKVVCNILKEGSQYAYLPGKSSALLIRDLLGHLQRRQTVCKKKWSIVSLDFSNAFGSVTHTKVLDAIRSLGADDGDIEWVKAWLTPKWYHNEFYGVNISRQGDDNEGLGQGCVLSPILFAAYTTVMIMDLNQKMSGRQYNIEWYAYADDFYLVLTFSKDATEDGIASLVGRLLQEIGSLLAGYNFQLSIEKTKILCGFHCALYGDQHIRILGVLISKALSFTQHIKEKLVRCHNTTMRIQRFAGKSFGLPPQAVLTLAKTVWVTSLSYAIEAWGRSLANKATCSLIDAGYRRMLRMAYRLTKDSPNLFIEALTNELPLSDSLVDRYLVIEMHKAPSWSREGEVFPNVTGFSKAMRRKWVDIMKERFPEDYEVETGYCGPPPSENVVTKIHIAGTAEDAIKEWRLVSGSGINIYTDGSVANSEPPDQRAGCGYTVVENGVEVYSFCGNLPHYCTIYQAEQVALQYALEHYKNGQYNTNMPCRVFVDAKSLLMALTRGHTNDRLRRIVNIINDTENLFLYWIPSHTNSIPFNDRADALANQGRYSGIKLSIAASKSCTIRLCKERRRKRLADDRQLLRYDLYHMVRSERQRDILQRACNRLPRMASLVVGHSRSFRLYMYRIGRSISPICMLCQVEEDDPAHRALRCAKRDRPSWVDGDGTMGQFT
ncbi:hypothetical protein FOL47_002048, partial [Perkinsus chesapeaki]